MWTRDIEVLVTEPLASKSAGVEVSTATMRTVHAVIASIYSAQQPEPAACPRGPS